MNLELRGNVWYATLLVPKDVRDVLGRVRFKLSLDTGSKREAALRAAPHIAQWKAMIKQACPYRVNSVQACRLKYGQGLKLVFG